MIEQSVMAGKTSTTVLEPLFVYGVKPEVHGGVFFAGDGASVVYPAGCGVAVYNIKVRLYMLYLIKWDTVLWYF